LRCSDLSVMSMANSSVSVKSPNADCHPVSLSPMNGSGNRAAAKDQ